MKHVAAALGLVVLFIWIAMAADERLPQSPSFEALASAPPLGWNSYDCYGMLATEGDIKANADYLATHLKAYGWTYVVLDYLWYAEGLTADNVRDKDPVQNIDAYGRLSPSPALHPSSTNGRGLKPLADHVHRLGLKFGLHIMRGIPLQAIAANAPVLGTSVRARDIADPKDGCSWYAGLVGVDTARTGGQEYYDSLLKLYAEWGVDYIKADDMCSPYHATEIEAVSRAIQKCGRPMVLSLSPGPAPLDQASHLARFAHLWRISGDFWDEWPKVLAQFDLCRAWAPHLTPGHWPDADMLPLGKLSIRTDLKGFVPRDTRLTRAEQRTVMTLWSIFRSPLMMGGNLPDCDAWTLSLLTNPEVLAVDQSGTGAHELFARDGRVAWVSVAPGSEDLYLALFNATDHDPLEVGVMAADLGRKGPLRVRDLWERRDLGQFSERFSVSLPAHGAGLYRIR